MPLLTQSLLIEHIMEISFVIILDWLEHVMIIEKKKTKKNVD